MVCETVAHYEGWLKNQKKHAEEKKYRASELKMAEESMMTSLEQSLSGKPKTVDNLIDESDFEMFDGDMSSFGEGELNLDDLEGEQLDDDVDTSDIDLGEFSENEVDELDNLSDEYKAKLKELIRLSRERKELEGVQ
ncbi:hypothetical protein GEMRC1_012242 [Eukaryota sp. GEM-RC1]